MKEILYRTPKKKSDSAKIERTRLDIVKNVLADYEERRTKRRADELQWTLNMDFFNGKQNSYVTNFDTLTTAGKQFHWQRQECFNHIAAIVESRLARITAHRSDLLPVGEDEAGVLLCRKVLDSALHKTKFDELAEQAAQWSEVTGSAFYKVFWDATKGDQVGVVKNGESEIAITLGDVSICVVNPFELYPDNMNAGDISEISSMIHAKTLPIAQIKETWGIDLSGKGEESVLVLERYERPTCARPNGRLTIVADQKLLFDGELPFITEEDGSRGLPFVRQTCEKRVGKFFGRSVIERAIPVQRAYNTIKNRKVEFLNRMACGVLAIEEGSVDIESLENEGLAPGKVIVYRAGSAAPKFMETGTMPAELEREEERLLREFETISGGTDTTRIESGNTSGVALEILAEQSNRRIARTILSCTKAKINIGCRILRLYKQFATDVRVDRLLGEAFTYAGDELNCCDIVLKPETPYMEVENG